MVYYKSGNLIGSLTIFDALLDNDYTCTCMLALKQILK